jgi:hypothetical protein
LDPGEGEDDGGGYDWSGKGASSGLIYSGDAVIALGEAVAFVGESVRGAQSRGLKRNSPGLIKPRAGLGYGVWAPQRVTRSY